MRHLAVNWAGLGDPQTTVVVYMGLATAATVRDGLIAAGRAAATPVAVLARGTDADSRRIFGVLEDLPALAAQGRTRPGHSRDRRRGRPRRRLGTILPDIIEVAA